ncbi:hypothetical protein BX592_111245 [Paraburkholderia rhizosphaerae]|uniref:Uncharacterized protein n=1 Tax=Paraburkholderia rhizosphaerae TaxID=480658 RepID=A0A4R8LQY5_9BURK|nr:hypothetical protein BX592_111245 [Paraburkholderia rhizosphaerae]
MNATAHRKQKSVAPFEDDAWLQDETRRSRANDQNTVSLPSALSSHSIFNVAGAGSM